MSAVDTLYSDAIDFTRVKRPRIVRFITGIHMALSHKGLRKICKNFKVGDLEAGEFVVFMNTACTAFKMLAPNNVLVYYRHPKEHRIDPRVIELIPNVFNGRELDMERATKMAIEIEFQRFRTKH